MGLDELALGGATGRARSALSRVVAFLPLPAFLRRRWADGLSALGPAGSSGAEQGASLAAKAVAVIAAALLVGGGAEAVHRATGHDSSKGAAGSSAAPKQRATDPSSGTAVPGGRLSRGTRGPSSAGGSSAPASGAGAPGGSGAGNGSARPGGIDQIGRASCRERV